MVRRKKNIAIDGSKLRALLTAKGYKLGQAGELCGLSKSGVQNWADRNEIPEYGVVLVESCLGIALDEYVKKQEEDPVEEEADTHSKCFFCERDDSDDDFINIMDSEENRFRLTATFSAKRRLIFCNVNFGSENVMADSTFVNYCPMCGKKLN